MSDQNCEHNPEMCATGPTETYRIEGRRDNTERTPENPRDRDLERFVRDSERNSNSNTRVGRGDGRDRGGGNGGQGGEATGGGLVIVNHPHIVTLAPGTHSYSKSPFPGSCYFNKDRYFQNNHNAIDVISTRTGANGFGEQVVSIEEGIVEAIGEFPDGSAVIIRGIDGYLTVYGHVKPQDGLQPGNPIGQGEPIGTTDFSGVFTRPDGSLGSCPNPLGTGCSHVHLARLKAHFPTPTLDVFSEVIDRISRGEGEFISIQGCTPVSSTGGEVEGEGER